MSSLSIFIERQAEVTIVSLRGSADMEVAHEIDAKFAEALADKPKILALDLSGLSYMNSLTIGAFMKAYQTLKPAGGRVCIINPSAYAQGVIKSTKSDTVLKIFPSVEAAMA